MLEIDLFAFIRYSDPTKVVLGERNVADGEAKLLDSPKGHTVPLTPPAPTALGDSGDSIDKFFDEENGAEQERSTEKGDDVLEETIARMFRRLLLRKPKRNGRNSLATLRGLILEDSSMFVFNLQAHPLVARSFVIDASVVTTVAITTIAADVFAVLPSQTCLGAEVRIRAEHTLEQKNRFGDKCSKQSACLLEKDAKTAHLRSLLSLKESEAVEAIHLREQVSALEAVDAFKGDELRDLKEGNFVLEGEKDLLSKRVMTLESMTALKETEVVSLESERGSLVNQMSSLESAFELFKQQMEAMQDEQATALRNLVMMLDAQLLEMSLKYCYALGQAIGYAINKGILDGLKTEVDYEKVGRDLSITEAYDPFAVSKYIDIVNALGAFDFSLLTKLESKKDASMVDLMDFLRLEGPLAEITGAEDLQHPRNNSCFPSIGRKTMHSSERPPYPFPSKSLTHGQYFCCSSTTDPITTLSMTFALFGVVPPLSVPDYQVLDMEPHDGDPSSTA
uniref:Transposase (Putative), gypsy type n=1 Tax=Tanacetum cinerariifolium TaxID=118510 RepID=A0A699GR59_TANCI|nr:hypothetical protein [Tanacetum cinerariifolium]